MTVAARVYAGGFVVGDLVYIGRLHLPGRVWDIALLEKDQYAEAVRLGAAHGMIPVLLFPTRSHPETRVKPFHPGEIFHVSWPIGPPKPLPKPPLEDA